MTTAELELAWDNHSSSTHPDVPNKPGKTNWVEKAGGLPPYIRRIARHLISDAGMSVSHAIATAVNTVKRWAHGGGNVTAATQAKAAKALAEWEAKRAAGRGLSRAEMIDAIELAWHFNPGQPRWPKGSGDKSGQWMNAGSLSPTGGKAAPVVSVAKKKPIKKNSVEYWQRARDLTVEARDKQKPGGAVWLKMEARRVDQEKMIAYMKETGKPTLTQNEWESIKTAASSPVTDEQTTVTAAGELKVWPGTEHATMDHIGISLSYLDDLKVNVAALDHDGYLFKKSDSGVITMSSFKPDDGTPYIKATPGGDVFYNEKGSSGSSGSSTAAVPVVSNKPTQSAPSVDRLKIDVPVTASKVAGPDTPLEFKNEDTREFGLAVMKDADRVHFEGTPEGDALSGRFIPMVDEVAKHYRDSKPDVSPSTKSTVRSYTGSGYQLINHPLRIPADVASSSAEKIRRMDQAMDKYATAEPMVLSRGIGVLHFPKENLAGKMIQDSAFMSTAVGGAGGFNGAVRMHILAPAGTHGVSVNGLFEDGGHHPNEREFILPRGTTILVSRDETVDGTRHVTGTIVPVPKSAVTGKAGVVTTPSNIDPKGYSKEGLEFLRTQGRKKWAARYAKGQELALSREAGTWYNRLTRERPLEIVTTGSRE